MAVATISANPRVRAARRVHDGGNTSRRNQPNVSSFQGISGTHAPSALQAHARTQGVSEVRLTRRGRLVVSVMSALMAALIGAVLVTVSASSGATASVRTTSYAVQPGDTLWSLAGKVRPGADRRDTVARLVELNPQAAGGIVAGETLNLPR